MKTSGLLIFITLSAVALAYTFGLTKGNADGYKLGCREMHGVIVTQDDGFIRCVPKRP